MKDEGPKLSSIEAIFLYQAAVQGIVPNFGVDTAKSICKSLRAKGLLKKTDFRPTEAGIDFLMELPDETIGST